MLAQVTAQQTTANAQENAGDICEPVFEVGTPAEARLDQLNNATNGRSANEDVKDAKAAGD